MLGTSGDGNPFDDDLEGYAAEDATNPLAEEVDAINPFAQEVEDTNPFAHEDDATNPFAKEVDAANPFDDAWYRIPLERIEQR